MRILLQNLSLMVISILLQYQSLSISTDEFVYLLNKKHLTDFGWTFCTSRCSCMQWDVLPWERWQLNDCPQTGDWIDLNWLLKVGNWSGGTLLNWSQMWPTGWWPSIPLKNQSEGMGLRCLQLSSNYSVCNLFTLWILFSVQFISLMEPLQTRYIIKIVAVTWMAGVVLRYIW